MGALIMMNSLLQREILKEIISSNILICTEEQNFENWFNAVKYLIKAFWGDAVEVFSTDGRIVIGTNRQKITIERFFEWVATSKRGGFVILTSMDFWKKNEKETKEALAIMENLCGNSYGHGYGIVFICPYAVVKRYMQEFPNVHTFINCI
jgi:hypothetical protein